MYNIVPDKILDKKDYQRKTMKISIFDIFFICKLRLRRVQIRKITMQLKNSTDYSIRIVCYLAAQERMVSTSELSQKI